MERYEEGDRCDYCHRMAHYVTEELPMKIHKRMRCNFREEYLCSVHARRHPQWGQ